MLSLFATNIIAGELLHLLMGSVIAVIIFWRFKSWRLVAVVLLMSFLVDLDHLFECFLIYGLNPIKIINSFEGNCFREAGKLTIFFHSWELIPLILFLGKKFRQWPLAISVTAAMAGHFLVDQITYSTFYGMSFWQYFFTYRAWYHFDFEKLCRG